MTIGGNGRIRPFSAVTASVQCLGPGHRLLLPVSALAVAGLVAVADTIARTAATPAEIPLGIITAAVGGR